MRRGHWSNVCKNEIVAFLLPLFFFLTLLSLVPASVKDSAEYNMQETGREPSWSSFGFVFTDHLVHSLVRKIEG